MTEQCQLKHKWLLCDDGKYECLNCHRVITKQELSIVRSLQNTEDCLIDPVPILQCNPQETNQPSPDIAKPQEIFVIGVKIPFGSIIDIEHKIFDTLHYAGELLSMKFCGIDADAFLLLECRVARS